MKKFLKTSGEICTYIFHRKHKNYFNFCSQNPRFISFFFIYIFILIYTRKSSKGLHAQLTSLFSTHRRLGEGILGSLLLSFYSVQKNDVSISIDVSIDDLIKIRLKKPWNYAFYLSIESLHVCTSVWISEID